jgi:hypothetical protein
MKLNLTFFTHSAERDMGGGIFIGDEEDLHHKLEAVWSIWPADRPYTWLASQPSRPSPTSGITGLLHRPPLHVYETVFENTPNPDWSAKEVGPIGPTLARLGPGFVPHHPLVSYYL